MMKAYCKHSAREVEVDVVAEGEAWCRLCDMSLPETTLHSWQRDELKSVLSDGKTEQRLVTLLTTFRSSLPRPKSNQGENTTPTAPISTSSHTAENTMEEKVHREEVEEILGMENEDEGDVDDVDDADAVLGEEDADGIRVSNTPVFGDGVFSQSRDRQSVDFKAAPLDYSELLRIPGVYWASICRDYRRPSGPHNIVLAVSVTDLDSVTAIKRVWRSLPHYRLFPLVVSSTGTGGELEFKRTSVMHTQAIAWWEQNQELVGGLFERHTGLVSAFVDPPVRKGQVLENQLSLVLVVNNKWFVPIGEEPFPSTLGGLPIDVRYGHIQPAAAGVSIHPSPNSHAWSHGDPVCFIGRSLGDPEAKDIRTWNILVADTGTLGAVVKDNGRHGGNGEICGLTCSHMVQDHKYVVSPSPIDQLYPTVIRHTQFKLKVSNACNDIFQGTQVDAALLHCVGKRLQQHGEWDACDPSECWAPRTNCATKRPKFFHQSGYIESALLAEGKYRYFGRTSGPTDVQFVLSREVLTRINAVVGRGSEGVCSKQLLIDTTTSDARGGDSGSVIWRVHEDMGALDAVGLLTAQLKHSLSYDVAQFLVATPIREVLQALDCELVRSDALPPPSSTSPELTDPESTTSASSSSTTTTSSAAITVISSLPIDTAAALAALPNASRPTFGVGAVARTLGNAVRNDRGGCSLLAELSTLFQSSPSRQRKEVSILAEGSRFCVLS